jgi:UMF1 family MFS transporter
MAGDQHPVSLAMRFSIEHCPVNPPSGRSALSAADRPARAPELVAWAFYDWANSAFAAMIQTFVFAAYFTRQVAADETLGTALWGNVTAAAGLLVAFGGPVLGALADQGGRRKPWILGFTILATAATALLWFVKPGPDSVPLALVLVGLGIVGAEFAVVFYNAMLPDLAPPQSLGRWSGWGWALGYAGGVACLVIALLGFVGADAWFGISREAAEHVRATFVLTAAWFLVFSIPFFLFTPDLARQRKPMATAVRDGFAQLADSIRHVRRYATILRFLVARMIYIDGLATIFAFGGVYAAGTFDMTESEVLTFGIALNVTAGLGALAFAWLDDHAGSRTTILISLAGLLACGAAILIVDSRVLFWTFGMCLGIFVGPVQAASRSYLARVAPPELRTEMFGLFALSGKATAFVGPLLVGWVTFAANSQRAGMATILFFFAAGAALMWTVPEAPREH